MDKMCSEGRMQLLPKASDKLQPSIRDDHLQNSVQAKHVSNVDLSILLNSIFGVDGYEVSGFGESIHDHPNQIKLAGSQRQSHNEIHANVTPLPIRNTQRLQQSSRFHVISLNLLTCITF
jgi:hypothetical protein